MSNPSASPEPRLNGAQARGWALEAGFTEAGLVALPYPNESRDAARFAEWVAAGRAATMSYLTRAKPEPDGADGELIRARVAVPFPWARSAIVCFANYNSAQPLSTAPAAAESGWIARYAWSSRVDGSGVRRPSDYHKVLLKRLKALEAKLHEQAGDFESRTYVDTGPVVERALATAAGLGWTGKNTCLIHPKLGSYGFLAVLLTSLDVQDQPSAAAQTPSQLSYKSRVPQVSILRPGIPQPSTGNDREDQTTTQPTLPGAPSFRLVSGERVGSRVPRVPQVSPLRPGIPQPSTGPDRENQIPAQATLPGAPSFRLVSGERVGSRVPQVSPLRPGIPQPSTGPDREDQTTTQPTLSLGFMTIPDRCGTCRRCLEACPTGALFAPYQMDATRCISYLTIEHRGPINAELMQGMGRQVFGCDICQDVCPWNRKSPIGADPELEPRAELVNPPLDWLAALDEPAFERHFNGSPIRRTGFKGLRRNLAIAMGNSGLARYTAKLEEWAQATDEGLRTAARWALEKLNGQ